MVPQPERSQTPPPRRDRDPEIATPPPPTPRDPRDEGLHPTQLQRRELLQLDSGHLCDRLLQQMEPTATQYRWYNVGGGVRVYQNRRYVREHRYVIILYDSRMNRVGRWEWFPHRNGGQIESLLDEEYPGYQF